MTTRAARAAFGAWIAVITVFYYAFPGAHLFTWALLGYSCAAAIPPQPSITTRRPTSSGNVPA